MARKRTFRVDGPYKHGNRWRVRLVEPEGGRSMVSFDTEQKAKAFARKAKERIPGEMRLGQALSFYQMHLQEKGNKSSSISNTMIRLMGWFNEDEFISELSESKIAAVYKTRCKTVSVDTHRNELAEVKTFFRWCTSQGYIRVSPSEHILPIGKRRRGKDQLRRGEAKRFSRTALKLAEKGDEGALASLTALLLGLRSEEIRCRIVRDLDVTEDETLLWIDKGKTDAARRFLEVPKILADIFKARCKGQPPEAFIFPSMEASNGYRSRTWLLKNVKRICRLAGVPRVPPHGLRGTQASLAEDAGAVGHLVAKHLGHESHKTTEQHYLAPGVAERIRVRRGFQALVGNESNEKEGQN